MVRFTIERTRIAMHQNKNTKIKPEWLSEELDDTLKMFDTGRLDEQELGTTLDVCVILNEARRDGVVLPS